MQHLGVFKWRKFISGLAKIGQLIQTEMGTHHGDLKPPHVFSFLGKVVD